jgi:hypothetical protein
MMSEPTRGEPMLGENDLRALLADRAAHAPEPGGRLAAVDRRVAAIRRRRVAAVGGALALLVGATVAGPIVLHRLDSAPATPPAHVIDHLPQYTGGSRLVAYVTLAPGQTRATLTFTGTWESSLSFARACPGADARPDVTVTFSGPSGTSSIGRCQLPEETVGPQLLNANGLLQPGAGSRVTVSVAANSPVAVEAGIYQSVPFPEYPHEPRPSVVTPPSYDPGEHDTRIDTQLILRPDPAQPNTTMTRTFTVTGMLGYVLRCTAPGVLHLSINGVDLGERRCDTYGLDPAAPGLNSFTDNIANGPPDTRPITRTYTVRLVSTYFTDPAWLFVAGPYVYPR